MKVVISNMKTISGLNEEQMNIVKEELTLDNPKYYSALKYSKYNTVKIPKNLYYFKENKLKKEITVPVGYKIPFKDYIVEDNRTVKTVSYPRFLLSLRDTQKEAYKSYINDTDNGLIVLPTGKGKSILGLYTAYALRQKVLVIVHKDDLVSGWKADAKVCFGDEIKVGLIKAKSRKVGDQVTIATIQTLARMDRSELETFLHEFGMIIMDECHHISSTSFDLVHLFSAYYKIGLSATPERSDGLTKVMYYHLGGVAFEYKSDSNDKDILPVEVHITPTPVNYEPMCRKTAKGYVIDDERGNIPLSRVKGKDRPRMNFFDLEEKIILDRRYLKLVLPKVKEYYDKQSSIVIFLSKKDHCRTYKDLLIKQGIPSEQIQLYYGDATESKEEMKRKAESKEVLITIATYSIATEGTNVKSWEIAFLISSLNNGKNVEQAIGRIRRSAEGKRTPVIAFDYSHPLAYSINRHIYTRVERYRKLDFTIIENGRKLNKMFNRGFQRK